MVDESTITERRRCPVCQTPLRAVVIVGPTDAIGRPCGHQFPPDALDD